jgi:DNA-binding LacI/PurR family transcriptional regulator
MTFLRFYLHFFLYTDLIGVFCGLEYVKLRQGLDRNPASMETFPSEKEGHMKDAGRHHEATIKDVAQLAGCGIATVSRVLNNKERVSSELREKVLKAAAELGYEISDLGRSLRSRKTQTIGCVVPSISNPVYSAAVQGIQDVAEANGQQLLLSCSNYDPEQELKAVRNLISKRVDAMVLTVSDAQNSAALELLRARKLPHCLLFNSGPGLPLACGVNNYEAARHVGQAFKDMGHRHLGYLALRLNLSDRSAQRLSGFRAICSELGLNDPIVLEVDEHSAALASQLQSFLENHPEITGIFASNDQLAITMMAVLRQLGKKVPQDISVIGFDGINFGLMMEPTLATIVTYPYEMGRNVAELVQAERNNTAQSFHPINVGFEYRPGGSLGPVRY